MAYCTQEDLILLFGEEELIRLTDTQDEFSQFSGEYDPGRINRAIQDAAAKIDSYLASRYTLPLAHLPGMLNRVACDIARYYLHDRSPLDEVTKRYEDAVAYLRQVSKGEVHIGVDETGTEPESMDGAQIQSGGSVFNRDDNGFI